MWLSRKRKATPQNMRRKKRGKKVYEYYEAHTVFYFGLLGGKYHGIYAERGF